MTWRVITISKRSKVDYKMNKLIVRDGINETQILLSEIYMLILESTAISITSYAICELIKSKCQIVCCDHNRLPLAMVNSLYGTTDSSDKIFSQIKWNNDIKSLIWKEIIEQKVLNQYKILNRFKPDKSKFLFDLVKTISPDNSSKIEAIAAKYYFRHLFGEGFSRDQDIPSNHALNYGYSILLSMVCREIISCGYITQLGINHKNQFNKYNLASDFMEPLRPIVDRITKELKFRDFDTETKHKIQEMLTDTVKIKEQEHHLSSAIRIYCQSIFKSIEENDIGIYWIEI